jgi:hypothetical protein
VNNPTTALANIHLNAPPHGASVVAATIPNQLSGPSNGIFQPKSYCCNSASRSANPATRSQKIIPATTSGTPIAAVHAASFRPCLRQIAFPTAYAVSGASAISRINA